jgi:hypothetical protein
LFSIKIAIFFAISPHLHLEKAGTPRLGKRTKTWNAHESFWLTITATCSTK